MKPSPEDLTRVMAELAVAIRNSTEGEFVLVIRCDGGTLNVGIATGLPKELIDPKIKEALTKMLNDIDHVPANGGVVETTAKH